MIDARDRCSVITPCYNDHTAFAETLATLRGELTERDEWIVVDSSTDAAPVDLMVGQSQMRCAVRVQHLAPAGVYAALNAGIVCSSMEWVQIVNSGDGLKPGARSEMTRVIEESPGVYIHVFRQQAGKDGQGAYIFTPDARGIWPHQSLLVDRRVYVNMGVYDVNLRLAADQLYFAQARSRFACRLHQFVLTYYDLEGLSSAVSWRASREIYAVWRALGRTPGKSVFLAWIRPWCRSIVQRTCGRSGLHKIKQLVFRHYRGLADGT